MTKIDLVKYYSTFRDRDLRKLLKNPSVLEEHKTAIRKLLKFRKENARSVQVEESIGLGKSRKKKSKTGMFEGRNCWGYKKVRVVQGGRVNPK